MVTEIESEYKIEMYTKVVKENYFLPWARSCTMLVNTIWKRIPRRQRVLRCPGFDWSQLNLVTAVNGQDIPLKYANVSGGRGRGLRTTRCLLSDSERRNHGRVSVGEKKDKGWKTLSMPAAEAIKPGAHINGWWDEGPQPAASFISQGG